MSRDRRAWVAVGLAVVVLALGALWWRSYFYVETVVAEGTYRWGIEVRRGMLAVGCRPSAYPGVMSWEWVTTYIGGGRDTVGLPWFRSDAVGWGSWSVVVPIWFVIAGPVGGIWWCLRERPVRAGVCVGCGYDLRESPVRCPECGREVGEEL